MRTIAPAAGQASGSGEAEGSRGARPTVPDGWGNAQGTHPIPIALNGQTGQDSDEQFDDRDDINSIEENIDYANYEASFGRDLSSIIDEDHPVQDERWSPGQDTIDYDQVEALGEAFAIPDSDIEISDPTPQAVEVEVECQTQANHDQETAGRTPAPQLKKQRNEDYDLNDSPLQEGFHRTAVATGDWQ
eukprot:4288355-Pyramimonas_sp.AAC.1